MAKIFVNPNPYTKTLDQESTKRFFYVVCAMLGMALAFWLTKTKNLVAGIVGYGSLAIFLYLIDLIRAQMGKNDRGENAEREVRDILSKLSDEYSIFRNVPIRKNLDIDFVVIGPTGIFAIEVKSHRKFYMYGSGSKFISQTMTEVITLKEYLQRSGIDIYVQAILVFTKAFVRYGYDPQKGIHIINRNSLLPVINQGRITIFDRIKTAETVKKLYSR